MPHSSVHAGAPLKSRGVTQHFDVVIVGGALGGLIAGGLLAKAGCRVLLVAPAADSDAEPASGRYAFAPQQSQCVRRVHDRLGLPLSPRMQSRRPPHRQVLLASRRIDVPYGRSACLEALAHEWPGMRAALTACFERLAHHHHTLDTFMRDQRAYPAPSGWQRLTLPWRLGRVRRFASPFDPLTQDALFGAIERGHPMRHALLAPLAGLGDDLPRLSYFAAIRALAAFWLDDPLPLGPQQRPGSAVWQRARALGAHTWPHAASHVQVAAKRRLGPVSVADSGQTATARVVLWNVAADETAPQLVGLSPGAAQFNAWPTPPRARTQRMAVLGDAGALPVGLAEEAIVLTDEAGAPAWRLERPAPAPGRTRWALLATWIGAHAAPAPDHLRAVLMDLAPDFTPACTLTTASDTAAPPGPLWATVSSLGGPLGLEGSAMRTPYANALCTQDEVLAVLGFEGCYWVGARAAEAALSRLKPKRNGFIARPLADAAP